MKLRLREKYYLTIISLVLIGIFLMAGFSSINFRFSVSDLATSSSQTLTAGLEHEMKKRGQLITTIVSQNLVNPLYHYDIDAIRELLANTKTYHNLLYIHVYDDEGRIIHDGTEENIQFEKRFIDKKTIAGIKNKNQNLFEVFDNRLEVSHPIWLGDLPLGGVKVALSLEEMTSKLVGMKADLNEIKESALRSNIKTALIASLIMIIFAGIATRIIASRLTNPIRDLSRSAIEVGKGNYDSQVPINSNDEIADLIAAFNKMKEDLQKTTISIDALETEVAERTKELTQVNTTLKEYKADLERRVIERTNKLSVSNTHLRKEIEERKELQEKLLRAQKMEAIGTLAAGVAHDLNNILSAIVSYPELLLAKLPENSSMRNPLLAIHKSGLNAAAILQDLLSLARRGVSNPEIVNLNQIVTEYLNSPEHRMIEHESPALETVTSFEADLMNIYGSPVQLTKTIRNLVANASEAMNDVGTICISLKNLCVDSPLGKYENIPKGDYVALTVSDTGAGIAHKDLDRIFEPFYTKKTMGRSGTGLGLAVVWGVVKDHNGYIDVKSHNGEGTSFTLFFPATRDRVMENQKGTSLEDYMGKGEDILIVDDMEDQRILLSIILEKLGYKVSAVSSGEDAVEYMRNHSPHLIILDMVMDTGIDGLDTFKQVIEIKPTQRAIIASGYAESDRMKEAQRLGVGAYVKKPYTVESIGAAVRNELDK